MKAVVIGAHLLRDDIEPLARAIPVGDLYLSAVDVPDDQPLGDRELLVTVAAVRGKLLETATFVAIRYGFSLRNDADALGRCSSMLESWRELLTQHRDHVELTLKVAADTVRPRPDRKDFSDGTSYLRALHDSAQAATVDPQFHAAVETLIVPMTVEHRWIHRDEKSIELGALIERDRLEELSTAGAELRRRCPSIPFLLSGPWPLEVFADADRQ
jgi:hypothetical protein